MKKTSIVVFASGNGSNAMNLIAFFKNHAHIEVSLLVTNNPNAPVIDKVKNAGIEVLLFDNEQFLAGNTVLQELDYREISWIVLAGFLRKIPESILHFYPENIINIHPSLLPNYGGKGMYGMHVHKAVFENKEKISGISIHLVNNEFDKGELIAQFETEISECNSAAEVNEKIQVLEAKHFAPEVERWIMLNDYLIN